MWVGYGIGDTGGAARGITLLIEPYPYILDYGISPSRLSPSLDTSGVAESDEGTFNTPLHPGNSQTKDEAGAKEAVL